MAFLFASNDMAGGLPSLGVTLKISNYASCLLDDQSPCCYIPEMEIEFIESTIHPFGNMNEIYCGGSTATHTPACSHKRFKMMQVFVLVLESVIRKSGRYQRFFKRGGFQFELMAIFPGSLFFGRVIFIVFHHVDHQSPNQLMVGCGQSNTN